MRGAEDKVKSRKNGRKKSMRHFVQIMYTALTNGYVMGFVQGKIYKGELKKYCVPGLNCHSCPGAVGACPIGSLQGILSEGYFRFAYYIVGFLLLFGSVMGRFVCGWLCPFGLLQDMFYKIPFFKKVKNLPGHRILIWLKYVILVLFVIILPMFAVDMFGMGKPWFCKYICPSGTMMAGIPLVILDEGLRSVIGFLYYWKVAILAVIVLLSIVVYRPFCKYFCPLGAIYSVFNPIAFYRYKVDDEKCTRCGKCEKVCKMGIKVYEKPNSTECIRCGDCVRECPHGAVGKSLFPLSKKL